MKNALSRKKSKQLTRAEIINYYCHIDNLISMTNNNAKTGPACLTLSLPRLSCDPSVPCYNKCYCGKGNQMYPNVQGAYHRNLRIWEEDPAGFEEQVYCKIKHSGLTLVRYTDSGDIPDENFLLLMVRLALKLPQVKFLAYTKKYKMVNEFLSTSTQYDNLIIRFSYWDKDWEVPNIYNLPTAYVNFCDKALNPPFPEKMAECPNQKDKDITCSVCRLCWNKKIENVIFKQH